MNDPESASKQIILQVYISLGLRTEHILKSINLTTYYRKVIRFIRSFVQPVAPRIRTEIISRADLLALGVIHACEWPLSGPLRNPIHPSLGLSRLCSATFEQLLAFGATFCGFSNFEQVLPFRAIFEQNIGLEHISSKKKSTISWKTSIHANFLKAYHVINLLNT